MARSISFRFRRPLAVAAGAAVTATVAATVVLSSGAQADVTSVGGGAFGARVDVMPAAGPPPVVLDPTPSVVLPAAGGGPITARAGSAAAGGRPPLLSTDALAVTTQGDTAVSHTRTVLSSATVSDTNLLDGEVTATVVTTSCLSNGDGSSGNTSLAGLGLPPGVPPVGATPAPNTVRTLPRDLGIVTFNEQVEVNTPGGTTSIVVNGIHVQLTGGARGTGDIVIAQSRCSANGPDVLHPSPSPSLSPSLQPSPSPSLSPTPPPSPSLSPSPPLSPVPSASPVISAGQNSVGGSAGSAGSTGSAGPGRAAPAEAVTGSAGFTG